MTSWSCQLFSEMSLCYLLVGPTCSWIKLYTNYFKDSWSKLFAQYVGIECFPTPLSVCNRGPLFISSLQVTEACPHSSDGNKKGRCHGKSPALHKSSTSASLSQLSMTLFLWISWYLNATANKTTITLYTFNLVSIKYVWDWKHLNTNGVVHKSRFSY